MDVTDILRDALFGNPPSSTTKPSREGVLAAFRALSINIEAAANGLIAYETVAARDADTSQPDGALGYVYYNNGSELDAANGFCQWSGSAWIAAGWLEDIIEQQVDSYISGPLDAASNPWQVSFAGPVIVDYAANVVRYPRLIIMRDGTGFLDANPLDYELDYFAVPMGGDFANEWHYLDVSLLAPAQTTISPVKSLDLAEVRAPSLTVVPLGSSLLDRYTNYHGAEVLFVGADPSVRPQSVAMTGGDVLFDPLDMMGGGLDALYVPLEARLYDLVSGADLANELANDECDEIKGYCKILLSPTDAAWALLLDMDTQFLASMNFIDAQAALAAKPDRVKILASKWGDTIDSTLSIVYLDRESGENQLLNGRTMDGINGSPVAGTGHAYAPVEGGNLTFLGFKQGWRGGSAGDEVLYNIKVSAKGSKGSYGFARFYVGLDQPVELGDLGRLAVVNLFNSAGVYLDTKTIPVERRYSAFEFSFAGTFDNDVEDLGFVAIGVGGGVTGAARANITGMQFHMSQRSAFAIKKDDYPTSDASRRFAYPRHMFLTKGRPLPLYIAQIAEKKADLLDLTPTFWSPASTFAGQPYEKQGAHMEVDPARITSAVGGIDLRPHTDAAVRYRLPLTVHAGPATGTGTVRLHFIGDSLTNREQPIRCAKKLEALGYTVQCIGTMQNNGGGTPTAPAYAGEARESREWADFIYEHTDDISPVAPGGEATYLAGDDDYKVSRNPYLLAASGSAPLVNNGYTFSLQHYLDRFSFADPTHILINLGRNDISQQSPAEALAQTERGFDVIYQRAREACADAHIGFVFAAEGRAPWSDIDWNTDRWQILLALLARVEAKRTAGDNKVWLLPAYAHMSIETGWGVTVSSTDAMSGMQRLAVADTIHMDPLPNDVARAQYAEVTSAWVHCTQAGV